MTTHWDHVVCPDDLGSYLNGDGAVREGDHPRVSVTRPRGAWLVGIYQEDRWRRTKRHVVYRVVWELT